MQKLRSAHRSESTHAPTAQGKVLRTIRSWPRWNRVECRAPLIAFSALNRVTNANEPAAGLEPSYVNLRQPFQRNWSLNRHENT
ncbi:unnamed protein product, partial [Iphiclides podalirius]